MILVQYVEHFMKMIGLHGRLYQEQLIILDVLLKY